MDLRLSFIPLRDMIPRLESDSREKMTLTPCELCGAGSHESRTASIVFYWLFFYWPAVCTRTRARRARRACTTKRRSGATTRPERRSGDSDFRAGWGRLGPMVSFRQSLHDVPGENFCGQFCAGGLTMPRPPLPYQLLCKN